MRRVAIAALVLVAIAIGVWQWRSRSRSPAVTAGSASMVTPVVRGERRPDPKTMVRGSIAGTITAEGKPLAGAQVCAMGTSPHLADDVLRSPACVRSDASGRYKLVGLLPALYMISASAKSYVPAVHRERSGIDLARGEHRSGVDVELRGGGVEVTGTVSDLTGGPIAGARVLVRGGPWALRATTVVETDTRGQYRAWVASGGVQLDVHADGYVDESELGYAPGTVDAKLTPEATLSGRVVDAASNSPVEGVRVGVYLKEQSFVGHTFSDATGAFRMRGLSPGRHIVVVHSANGWGRTDGSVLVSLGQDVSGIVMKLHPATRVRGKVLVSTTKQPCGAVGAIGSLFDVHRERSATLHAERDGTVWADGVLPGSYMVTFRCAGFVSRHYPLLEVQTSPVQDVVWEVDPGATVRGKVLVAGQPIAHAVVSALGTGASSWARAVTDRNGTYELTGIAPGTYTIDISSPRGIGPRDGWTLDVPEGGAARDFVLELGGGITGIVVDGNGVPVAGVEVTAREAGVRWGTTVTTNAAGIFALEQLRPGSYHVIAQREWSSLLRKPGTTDDENQGENALVQAGAQTNVRLTVETLDGQIRGTVVDASDRPVTDAFVTLARQSDAAGALASRANETRFGDTRVLTSTSGAFTIDHLPPGKYTVRAQRSGAAEAIAEHVSTGATVKLVLPATAEVSGTVTANGQTPDDVLVTVRSQATGFRRDEKFYKTSTFVVRDLPPGKVLLTASGDVGEAEVEFDLQPGATHNIALVLDQPVTISGRVVDHASREPIANVVMSARSLRGSTMTFHEPDRANTTDPLGRFTIRRAPRGAIALMGWADRTYEGVRAYRTVSGSAVDLGDIPIVKLRVPPGTLPGVLGANFAEQRFETLPEQREHRVSYIDPAGPAAKSGIVVGDVLISIDGHDIRGGNSGLADALLRAPPGTKLALGLARGVTVHVVLAAP